MGSTPFAALLLAAPALLGCALAQGTTVASGPGFVLHSPFDAEETEEWRGIVGRELTAVASFVHEALPDPPVVVFLETTAVQEESGLLERLNPNVHGVQAWAVGGLEVHLIVGSADGGLFSVGGEAHLRHELAHVFLKRMGVEAPPWFDEGFAHEIEDAVSTQAGLELHPAPVQLILARAFAPGFAMDQLWSWDGARTRSDPEREAVLRLLSRSIVRFLLERAGPDAWRREVRRMAAVESAERPALEREWRRWLDDMDFTGRIEDGMKDRDEAVRRASAETLPVLADCVRRLEGRAPVLGSAVDSRLDGVAVRSAGDPACLEATARFLLFFRARDLPESSVVALAGSPSPQVQLVGLALRAQRGSLVESSPVQGLWEGLGREDRRRLGWLRLFLPLPGPR
jgi:hypothetical protein